MSNLTAERTLEPEWTMTMDESQLTDLEKDLRKAENIKYGI